MNAIKIRVVQEEDFNAINSMMLEVNPADAGENVDLRKDIFSKIVNDPSNYIFAGVINSEIVTTCYLNTYPILRGVQRPMH